MLELLLNSKAGANLGAGLGQGIGAALGGGGGPMVSGGSVDARSFMDGSGWTVTTGQAKATGATRSGSDAMAAGSVPSWHAGMASPQQAGFPWLLLLAGGGALWLALR